MKQTDSRKETAERTLKNAVSRFMSEQIADITQGKEPKKPVEHYIQEEWYYSGLTGLELKEITDAGVQIWKQFEPQTELQATDLMMRTDSEIKDLVDSLVDDTTMTVYDSRPDLSLLSTSYRKLSGAAKGAIASTALIFALSTGFSAANMACVSSDTKSMKPTAAQVEKGSTAKETPGGNGRFGTDECLETKLDMKYDSTRFIDKTAKKQIEQYVLAAAKAGAREIYVGGFASIEDKLDLAKGKAVNDDAIYNVKLSKNRARKVAAIAKNFIRKHKLDKKLKVVIKSFGETEAFGTDKFPNKGYNPNRAAVLASRPFEDPDKTPAMAPSNGRRVSCEAPITDAVAKKDGWTDYKEVKAQPAPTTTYAPQPAPEQPKVTVIIQENPYDQKVQALEKARQQHLQNMEKDVVVYRWQKKTYNRECRPNTIENSLCSTTGYSQYCKGGEPKPTSLNPASACVYLDKDMRTQEEKLGKNIKLMETILYNMRVAQADQSNYAKKLQRPAPATTSQPAKNTLIHVPNGAVIEYIENPNKGRSASGTHTSRGLL